MQFSAGQDAEPQSQCARRAGSHTTRVEALAFACVFLTLLGLVSCLPLQLFGDAREYLGMAASILRTHNFVYEREDLTACAEMMPPETFLPDQDLGHLTKPDKHGRYVWGTHSIYYSIIGTPFVAAMGARGFLALNALCFVFALAMVYFHLRELNSPLTSFCLALACLALSPVLSYVFWIHTEVLVTTLVLGVLFFGFRGNIAATGLCLGVACALKPMLVLALLPVALWHYREKHQWRPAAKMVFIAAIVAFPQILYNLRQFGSLTSMGGWVSLSYIHLFRVFTLWFDPAEGMLWFYPIIIWCLVRNRWPLYMLLTFLVVVVLMSITFCVGSPFHTHQIGWRYCAFFFPFFLIMAGKWEGKLRDWAPMACTCFLGGALLLNPLGGSGVYYGRCNLARKISERIGVPSYPESFFATPNRLSRNIAVDYMDNWKSLRNDRVQIQVRNAEEGELVVKLYLTPGLEPGEATLWHTRRHGVSADLAEGRVATLTLPVDKEDFIDCVFHDLGNQKVPVARLRLEVPLSVMSGGGELYWQRRYFTWQGNFLYMAGPVLLEVFPAGDWILQAAASEGLPAVPEQFGSYAGESERLPALAWDETDAIEGTRSLKCTTQEEAGPGSFAGVRLGPVRLEEQAGARTQIQMSTWFKSSPPDVSDKGIIVVDWLNEEQQALQRIEEPCAGAPGGKWGFVRARFVPPPGAKYVQIAVGLKGGSGTIKLDDFVVSRYIPPW